MTLVVPDPTRAVPLPLREQADVRDRWLTQRLLDVLPGLMDRAGIDLWLVVGREYNEDPVLATLLPATWLSARRRTILALHRSDDGVTAPRSRPIRSASSCPPGHPTRRRGCPREQSQWAAVRRIVEQADPRRIGIDVSESFALADGLSHTDHRLLDRGARPLRRPARPGRGPRRRLAGDPAARGDRRPPRPQPVRRTRSSTRPSPPPSSPPGRRRRSTSPGGSASASTTSGWSRGSSRRSTLQRAGVPLVEAGRRAAARRPLRRRHRAGRPGALRRRAGQPRPEDRHPAQRLRAAGRRDDARRRGSARRCAPATGCRT